METFFHNPNRSTVPPLVFLGKARIAGALGGRAAEQLVFGTGQVTTGAGGDLQQAAGDGAEGEVWTVKPCKNMGVFPPKSFIKKIGCSIIFTIHFWGFSPIFGNTHIYGLVKVC